MKKYAKTVKHYKTLRNCLKRNMYTRIYWGYTERGYYWFNELNYHGYLDRERTVTLEYNDIYQNWELHFYLM